MGATKYNNYLFLTFNVHIGGNIWLPGKCFLQLQTSRNKPYRLYFLFNSIDKHQCFKFIYFYILAAEMVNVHGVFRFKATVLAAE